MSDTLLQMIFLHSVRKFRRDIQRRFGLANPRNVVQFALNAKERCIGNIFGHDRMPTVHHFPFGQCMVLKNNLNRLKIELCRQVHHCAVFLVKRALPVGGVVIALDEMLEQLVIRRQVAVEIHGNEIRQLHEPGIDLAERARIWRRHIDHHITLKPFDIVLFGELIDLRR